MIDVSELKIGNYIFDDEGIVCRVIGLEPFEHSVRCDEHEGCYILIDLYPKNGRIYSGYKADSPSCKPIPLTEDWLVKFNFEFDGASYLSSFAKREDYRVRLHVMDYGIVYCLNTHSEVCINTVHQLQNLVHALTGRELQII